MGNDDKIDNNIAIIKNSYKLAKNANNIKINRNILVIANTNKIVYNIKKIY